jgi:hypothetical protein
MTASLPLPTMVVVVWEGPPLVADGAVVGFLPGCSMW